MLLAVNEPDRELHGRKCGASTVLNIRYRAASLPHFFEHNCHSVQGYRVEVASSAASSSSRYRFVRCNRVAHAQLTKNQSGTVIKHLFGGLALRLSRRPHSELGNS